jgi:peptide deformylase
MSDILTINSANSSVLREKADFIYDVNNPALQNLIDDLIFTAKLANGVGIAAPQVAQSLRLFIVVSRPSVRYPHAPNMLPTAMINPQIIAYSGEIIKGWEGCLSVPGVRGLVPRYEAIAVEYINRDGVVKREVLTDFVARIFQHEYDHLEGILFSDRVESSEDLISEDEYQKIMV